MSKEHQLRLKANDPRLDDATRREALQLANEIAADDAQRAAAKAEQKAKRAAAYAADRKRTFEARRR